MVGVGWGVGVGTGCGVGEGCGVGVGTGCSVGVREGSGVNVAAGVWVLPGSGVVGISHADCNIGTKTHNRPMRPADLRALRIVMTLLEARCLQ